MSAAPTIDLAELDSAQRQRALALMLVYDMFPTTPQLGFAQIMEAARWVVSGDAS